MLRWGWLFVGIVVGQATPASSGEDPQPPKANEIKTLIDRLVSPNPAPDEDKLKAGETKADGGFPRDFDHKKQAQVHRACVRLTELGPQAFPLLIERWEDKRYCLTTEVASYTNKSVGEVCRSIIHGQLQPYGHFQKGYADPRGKPHRPDSAATFLGSQKAARQWWEKNKDKTLSQMQLEVLDWVIAEESKRRGDFTDEERRELQALRKKLVKGGKPLAPMGIPAYEFR
jgi:hypothetical protein